MQKFKYVRYLVGTFLIFPIYCIHKIPVVLEKKQKKDNYPSPEQTPQKKAVGDKVNAGHKRTCGHANKSVRMSHKKQ